jgi:hypothetical protein
MTLLLQPGGFAGLVQEEAGHQTERRDLALPLPFRWSGDPCPADIRQRPRANGVSADVLSRYRLLRKPDGFEGFGLLLEHPKASDLTVLDREHGRDPCGHFDSVAPLHMGGVYGRCSKPPRRDPSA